MNRDGRDDFQDDSAVARYVAHDGGGVAPSPDASELDTFARCDAALAIAPRLADSPELAWAYAEARRLARGAPPAAALPWYRRVSVAWSTAALSAAAAAGLAIHALLPPGEDVAQLTTAVADSSFATAITTAELADRIAQFEPVLIGETIPVDGRSLVVLPFSKGAGSLKLQATAKAEPADALYDRLVRQLAGMPGLYVVDAATAAIYADGTYSPEQIALYLGVRGVLQGNVYADGGRIYLEFHFTDAAGAGREIERNFERPVGELALLQNDVAQSLIDVLGEAPAPVEAQP
jgi:TolB-like protein